MSPTDSQPKEKPAPAAPTAKTTPSYGNLSQPSLARRITGAFDDVYVLGWAFIETLLSPILDPSSWTRLPSQGPTPETPRPLFGSGGNRLGGGGGSWFGGGGGGGGGGRGANSGSGSGGRRTGGFGTLGGLSGSGGTVDGCRGTCG